MGTTMSNISCTGGGKKSITMPISVVTNNFIPLFNNCMEEV